MLNLKKINITIDGHSGSGKSSTARAVAKALGFVYIDTGAMYRAVTWAVLEQGIDLEDEKALEMLLSDIHISFVRMEDGSMHTFLNGRDLESDIRGIRVAGHVSEVSRIPQIREKLVEWQRELAKDGGAVMEGRDAGTVVLPNAELKVFMTASIEVRAQRRWEELQQKGMDTSLDEIRENLGHRDKLDSSRDIAPLVKAEGAVEIDTSNLSFEQQVGKIVDIAQGL